jgi:hypothetical protein
MMRKMTSIIRRNWSTILQQSSHTGFRGLGGGVGIRALGGVGIRGLGGVGIRGLGRKPVCEDCCSMVLQFLLILLVVFHIMLLLFYSLLEVVQIRFVLFCMPLINILVSYAMIYYIMIYFSTICFSMSTERLQILIIICSRLNYKLWKHT